MKHALYTIFILSQMLLLLGCKEDTMLLNKIDQYQVNKIIATLQSNGIESSKVANKKGDTFNIVIDKSDLASATVILNAKGPFTPSEKLSSPCEFKGLIATPSEEKQCRKHRLETELEITLGQIDGVLNADVHIVLSKKAQIGYDLSFSSSSAAVFIKHQTNIDLSLFKTNIKRLIEKSIPGLTYDKVTLVFIPALVTKVNKEYSIKNQNSSNIIISILIVLLLFSWSAFIFKERLQKLKFIQKLTNLYSKNLAPEKFNNKEHSN